MAEPFQQAGPRLPTPQIDPAEAERQQTAMVEKIKAAHTATLGNGAERRVEEFIERRRRELLASGVEGKTR